MTKWYKTLLLLTLPLLLSSNNFTPQASMNKPELIYVFDPLCGWCYGFSPVMQKLKQHFGDSLDYSVYTGGLVTGDRVGTLNQKFSFIPEANKRVEQLTGTLFGEGFKTNVIGRPDDYIFNSVPPGKAFVIMKELKPDDAVELAHEIQNAVFWDGKNLFDTETYTPIAEKHGIDSGVFAQRFADTAYDNLLYKDFQTAHYLQGTSFPYVLLKNGEQYYLLTRGYSSYDDIKAIIDKILSGE